MFFDPFYLLFMVPGLLLSLWATWRVRSTFTRYSHVRTATGLTGADAAGRLLAGAGVHDVRIVATPGHLSDHYNPATKTLALSQEVYGSPSVAAVGVACHEAGHAIQHAQSYAALSVRSFLVPTANIGSSIGYLAMFGGLLLQSQGLVVIGAVLFSAVLLFQVVTLPVEFDASARARRLAFEQGIVLDREREGMSDVLNAAAMTYIAAVVSTLLTLLYFLFRAGLLGGRRDD